MQRPLALSAPPFAPLFALACALPLALGACADEQAAPPRPDPLAADPLAARALHDPLMIDPDLSLSTQANAAVTLPASHALPPLVADEEAALAAREAARLDLLKDGRVPDLPAPSSGRGPAGLAGARTAPAMLKAAGAPAACAGTLAEGFGYAADLPQSARIMPHGMVQQAAGSTGGECEARVIRYLTPAAGEDALHHHFIRAERAE